MIIAASGVDPEWTLEEAQQIWDDPDWGNGEVTHIYNTAMAANRTVRDVLFTLPVTEQTGSSDSNSITPPNEEYLTGIS